jgi:hypothetical protein
LGKSRRQYTENGFHVTRPKIVLWLKSITHHDRLAGGLLRGGKETHG